MFWTRFLSLTTGVPCLLGDLTRNLRRDLFNEKCLFARLMRVSDEIKLPAERIKKTHDSISPLPCYSFGSRYVGVGFPEKKK